MAYWYSFISKEITLVFDGQPWFDKWPVTCLVWYPIEIRNDVCLGSILNADMHVLVSISDWYRFNICIFVQIWVISVWYMCNVWFLILFFISCFSCTICVLLCALCVGKDYQIHSNVSVVFCGGISASRYTSVTGMKSHFMNHVSFVIINLTNIAFNYFWLQKIWANSRMVLSCILVMILIGIIPYDLTFGFKWLSPYLWEIFCLTYRHFANDISHSRWQRNPSAMLSWP